MKVLHVAGSFFPADVYGGPIESTRHLCAGLSALGVECVVVTTDGNGPGRLSKPWRTWAELDGASVFYAPRWARPDVAPRLLVEFFRGLTATDIVHATGTYNWFLSIVARACALKRTPLVLSPRGSLMSEAKGNKPRRKRLYDRLVGTGALRRVTRFHATSDEEAEGVRGIAPGARISVIPNGVVVPLRAEDARPAGLPASGRRYLLYMGRLHPYKRIDRIIKAFAMLPLGAGQDPREQDGGCSGRPERPTRARGDQLELWIAGWGEHAYRAPLEALAQDLGVGDRVRFLGHVSGSDKSWALENAVAVVQAAKAESFGLVVAEALAHGAPCVVTKTLPWRGLHSERCGVWVEDSPEAIARGIGEIVNLSEEDRRAWGRRGRDWMARDFCWESIAGKTLAMYEQAIGETARGALL